MEVACLPLVRRLDLPSLALVKPPPTLLSGPNWRNNHCYRSLSTAAQLMGPLAQREPVVAMRALEMVTRRCLTEGTTTTTTATTAATTTTTSSTGAATEHPHEPTRKNDIVIGSTPFPRPHDASSLASIATCIFESLLTTHAVYTTLKGRAYLHSHRHNQATAATGSVIDAHTPPIPPPPTRNNLEKKKQLRCVQDHICDLLFLLSDLLHSAPSREDALWLARRCLNPDAALFSSSTSSSFNSINPKTDKNTTGESSDGSVSVSTSSQTPRSLVDFLVQDILLPVNVTTAHAAADGMVVGDREGEGANTQGDKGSASPSSANPHTTTASVITNPSSL